MSYIRVNLSDVGGAISGDLHGSMTDALVAALMAEPETIEEFENCRLSVLFSLNQIGKPLRSFSRYENLEPYDAGILAVDLAARLIGVESTYTIPSMEGSVRVSAEFADVDDGDGFFHVPYKLPGNWKIIHDLQFYEGMSRAGARQEPRICRSTPGRSCLVCR